jgi:hypothetical protein
MVIWRRVYQGVCDDSAKALVVKNVTMGGAVTKMKLNCVTSFMDDA